MQQKGTWIKTGGKHEQKNRVCFRSAWGYFKITFCHFPFRNVFCTINKNHNTLLSSMSSSSKMILQENINF